MQLVYAGQAYPTVFHKSLYLAGPVPRDANIASWRSHALALLTSLGYDGVVFIPEALPGEASSRNDQPWDWEHEALRHSDVILVWLPAAPETRPDTPNQVELGIQIHLGKVIVGLAADAYLPPDLARLSQQYQVRLHRTLPEIVQAAVTRLGAGAERAGAECRVPLDIWQTRHFQQWYTSQTSVGHSLQDVINIEWVFRVGPERALPLLMAMHVAINVCGEGRIKSNEVVLIRPSIVTICAYCPGENRLQDRFVLVKEYRTPVLNATGFVWELPGGSSLKEHTDPVSLAMEELSQETGLHFSRDRFRMIEQRQLAATLFANQACLLAIELEPAEINEIATKQGEMYGNSTETEQTYLYIMSRQQILEDTLVDYVTLGQISLVGYKI
jgi:nucleoside 2-deoxyribosyltransferase/8-oxo-dGTP pyrophosphatase MutT (NUDIX family)